MGEYLQRAYDRRFFNSRILAHRGYWLEETEKNTLVAFQRAFDHGFGVETDLRDIKGEIVISHDMPQGGEMPFEVLLSILNGRDLPLALNIKADGMGEAIRTLLERYRHTSYFTFDMSIPEMVHQHQAGLIVYAGLSDITSSPTLLEKAKGIWLDSFYTDWFGEKEIQNLLNQEKRVCIVSPELHKRAFRSVWEKYKDIMCNLSCMICTDYPEEAARYFYEEN